MMEKKMSSLFFKQNPKQKTKNKPPIFLCVGDFWEIFFWKKKSSKKKERERERERELLCFDGYIIKHKECWESVVERCF